MTIDLRLEDQDWVVARLHSRRPDLVVIKGNGIVNAQKMGGPHYAF